MKWAKISLGEITTKIGSGATPKGGEAAYETEGISLIRSLNVYDLEFKINNLAFINDRQAKKLANVTVNRNDILLNITGASVCRCTKVPDRILPARVNQHVAIIRCNTELVDSDFLLYYLVSPRTKRLLLNIAQAGGTREALTKEDLQKFEIELPPLPIQQKIAATLAAYDDLIENNQRRIALLERMAREIYREWFVRLRFPGWEETEVVDGVPGGWMRKRLNDMTKMIKRGITPIYDEDGFSVVINQKCIRNQRLNLKHARNQSKKIPKNRVVQPFDILVNSTGIGTLGRTTQVIDVEPNTTVDTHVTIVRPKESINPYFLGYAASRLQPFFELVGSGSTGQSELNVADIQSGQVLVPSTSLQTQFGTIVEPIIHQNNNLTTQNHLLRQTRDRLLPRLLRGELL